MTINALPALDRTSATFRTELDTYFGTQLPAFAAQANALQVDVNAKKVLAAQSATDADAQRALALGYASAAQLSAAQAAAGANFKGAWSTLTGPLNRPASVSRAGSFWLLNADLANVSAAEPGVSASWTPLLFSAAPTLAGATVIYVGQTVAFDITNYSTFATYAASITAGSVSLAGAVLTINAPATAQTLTLTASADGATVSVSLDVLAAGVETPTNASPTNGVVGQGASVTLASSAFAWIGTSDTHAASDWQLATDAGFATVVQSTTDDAANLTSWTVTGLSVSQTYYWRVRHTGANIGTSAWSAGTSFITKSAFSGMIGTPGAQGFGVGECPTPAWLTTLGLSAITGTGDPTHDNYGNYQHTNGGIAIFIPKFYYKFADTGDASYYTYGANTLTVRGTETYSTEAAANAAGFALHRAFIDNNTEKVGFFVDKYLASKNSTTSCKSVQLGMPIGLGPNGTYNGSSNMTGCTGILADAVVLARSRGANWNAELIFQRDCLAKLSLAHAQHATSVTHCAWFDSGLTTNFPKGCNNGSYADTNDASVTFTSASDGNLTRPLTGSASSLAKTTHNGQASGVTDINGAAPQLLIGLTQAGAAATTNTGTTSGNSYILKRTARHATLTAGHAGSTDAWGTDASLASLFEAITGFLPWENTGGSDIYFGNGSAQVFSGALSGTDYLRSCCGVGNVSGMGASTGTSQFGNDANNRTGATNLCPVAAGSSTENAKAGVFRRGTGYRSLDSVDTSFRATAYGD